MKQKIPGINPNAVPSGAGCAECLATGGWWLHLRRCAECGHIGCCDSSPGRHARRHFHHAHHPIITSYEPGESWFYDYSSESMIEPPSVSLAPPTSHPADQPTPGPAGKVPPDWMSQLH